MNTLKKCILLGILILNLIPYMQDGKVKWTMMEAGAQYYTIENTGLGIWICGEYADPFVTIISSIDCSDLRDENVEEAEPCYCGQCGLPKTVCDEPCSSCSSPGTVDEDGNDYFTGESECTCASCSEILPSCSSLCAYANCPSNDQEGGGSQVGVMLSGTSSYELLQSLDLYVNVSGVSINNVKFLIEDEIVDNGVLTSLVGLARTPGHFSVRAFINNQYYSNEITINILYPNSSTIFGNSAVVSLLEDAKANTLSKGEIGERVEYGASIYINTIMEDELSFFVNAVQEGDNAPCGTQAELFILEYPDNPMSVLEGGSFRVASYHSHPSLSMCDSITEPGRFVGPSPTDIETSNTPDCVYDYIGDTFMKYSFTPISAPQKKYYFGLDRRE